MTTFKIFDSKAAFTAPQQASGKSYTDNETFGLKSLSDDFIETLTSGIKVYENYHLQYSGSSGKSRADYQAELNEARVQNTKDGLDTARRVLTELKKDQQNQRDFDFREKQTAELQKPAFWQATEDAAVGELHQAQTNETAERWEVHGKFANHHPEALVNAYQTLAHLRTFFKTALDELNERKNGFHPLSPTIPDAFYKGYHTYLQAQLQLVAAEYNRITKAMQTRLKLAADSGNLFDSDILLTTINQLKTRGVINPQFAVDKTPQQNLTKESFLHFHHAIDTHGSIDTQQRLAELPWFQTKHTTAAKEARSIQNKSATPGANAKRVTTTKIDSKTRLAQRFGVADLIPKDKPRYSSLFIGTHIRHKFFDDFHAIASVDTAIAHFKNKSSQDTLTLKKLERLEQLAGAAELQLEQESNRVKKDKSKVNRWPWSWFNDKTFKLINSYQSSLDQQRATIAKTRVEVLERLAGSIEQNIFSKGNALTPQERNQIKALIDKADAQLLTLASVNSSLETHNLQSRLNAARNHIQQAASTLEERLTLAATKQQRINKHNTLLQPLQQNSLENPATPEALDRLLQHYRNLPKIEEGDTVAKQFLDELDSITTSACQQLHTTFAPIYTSNDNPTSDTTTPAALDKKAVYTITQGKIIQELGTVRDRMALNDALDQYTFAYLENWADSTADSKTSLAARHKLAEAQEKVLLALGDEKTCQTIQKLQQLRQEGRLVELGQQADKQRAHMEQHIVNTRFAQDFKNLDKALFWYLKNVKRLDINKHQLAYLGNLCDRMAADNVTEVEQYKNLTPADRVFLGLQRTGIESMLPDFINDKLNPGRKPLCAVINICTTLRVEAKRLPYIRGVDAQNKYVANIKQKINQQIQKHGNPQLSRFMSKMGVLRTPNAQTTVTATPATAGNTPK